MSFDNLSRVEFTLRAVSDKTRLRIISLLVKGEQSVCQLADALQLAQPTVSRHLAYLKKANLVQSRKEANRVFYRLAHPESNFHEKLLEALSCGFDGVWQLAADTQRLESARQT